MIAMVKIANWERWCEAGKKKLPADVAGTFVEIDTASMRTTNIDGEPVREWNLAGDSEIKFIELTGIPQFGKLCEHVLEMD